VLKALTGLCFLAVTLFVVTIADAGQPAKISVVEVTDVKTYDPDGTGNDRTNFNVGCPAGMNPLN
jgi:hypothetical protein